MYKKLLLLMVLFLLPITQIKALNQTGPRYLITSVMKESTAEKMGLKEGDIILSINGKEIFDDESFDEELKSSRGKEIEIKVLRDGRKITLKGIFNTKTLGIYKYFIVRDRMLSPDEMKEDLDTMYDAIEEIHPNPYFNITKKEFDKLKESTYAKIKKPMSTAQFWKIAAKVVASIGDGHTSLWMPNGEYLYQIYNGKNIVFPLKLRIIDSMALVEKNFSVAPIKEGDEVLSINGMPMRKIINDFMSCISGELPHFKTAIMERYFSQLLFAVYGFKDTFYIKIKDTDGKVEEYKVKGGGKETYEKMLAYGEDYNFYFDEIPELKAGIIRFNYFAREDAFSKFLKNTFKKIKEEKYKYLIIDLRNNGGGNSAIAEDLLDYITDKPYRYYSEVRGKISRYTLKYFKGNTNELKIDSVYSAQLPLKSPPKNPLRFEGKVFVLTSHYTFSTASDFAAVIKDFKIGTLVGEETGGLPTSYGDIFRVNLPNSKLKLGVSWKYFVRPGGDTTYVHHGVLPDIYVKTTKEDLQKGKDPVMEKVKEIIKKDLKDKQEGKNEGY